MKGPHYAFKASFHVEPLNLICLLRRIGGGGGGVAWEIQKDI